MDRLSIVIDHEQRRQKRPRIASLVSGSVQGPENIEIDGWDSPYWSNTFYEPINRVVMLLPGPFDPLWYTTGTGIYDRFNKADYTLTTGAKWLEENILFGTDVYLVSQNVNEAVITASAYERNRGFFLQWFAYNTKSDVFEQMRCGWGTAKDYTSDYLSLRFWSDGSVWIYKNGVFIGEESIRRKRDKFARDAESQDRKDTFVGVMLLPYRKKELLVLTTDLQGFSFAFEDIEETDDDPEIVPATKFWWYVPTGQAKVQCAPIRFPTSGYITSTKCYFMPTPPTGAIAEDSTVYQDAPGYGTTPLATASLVRADAGHDNGSEAFIPDGTLNTVRHKISFASGDGISSPWVYGVQQGYKGETVYTSPGPQRDLIDLCTSAEFSVSEGPENTTFTLEFRDPNTIEDTYGVPAILTQSNRPVYIAIGTQVLMDGRSEAPEWDDRMSSDITRFSLEVRDYWKYLENYYLEDATPLDGLRIGDAFKKILTIAGLGTTDFDIEDPDFTLPTTGEKSTGEFAVLMEAGDKLSDWITRLKETYAPLSYVGFVPMADGVKFRFRQFESMDLDNPELYLYGEIADAGNDYNIIWRTLKQRSLEPEANDIWVIGKDPRSPRPIVIRRYDEYSSDPSVPPDLRPSNSLLESRRYSLVDPTIQDVDILEDVRDILFQRLSQRRWMAEITCTFLRKPLTGEPIWAGDIVFLDGGGTYRVVTIQGKFTKEPRSESGDSWTWREFTYTLELMRPQDEEDDT